MTQLGISTGTFPTAALLAVALLVQHLYLRILIYLSARKRVAQPVVEEEEQATEFEEVAEFEEAIEFDEVTELEEAAEEEAAEEEEATEEEEEE